VQDRLEAGDVTTARGFLLAAPAMLSAGEAKIIEARVNVADGSKDQAVVEAALAYLPDEVQDTFERMSAPAAGTFSADRPPPAGPSEIPAAMALEGDTALSARSGAAATFSVLGDLRDLSLNAAQWVRDETIAPLDEFAFALSGVSLIFADEAVRSGASIVMSARRAGRLDPEFATYLSARLFNAVPPQRLKRVLRQEFQTDFGYSADSTLIERAFRGATNPSGLEGVFADLRIISEMSRGLTPGAAIAILGTVRDGGDLRRARLVAQAGGERAVALAEHVGEDLLGTARTAVRWTDGLRMNLGLAGGVFLLLSGLAIGVFTRSLRRNPPMRRSAVYALDESYWP